MVHEMYFRIKLDTSSQLLQLAETKREDECLIVRAALTDIFQIHEKYCFHVSSSVYKSNWFICILYVEILSYIYMEYYFYFCFEAIWHFWQKYFLKKWVEK